MEIIASTKGKPQLLYNGFSYRRERILADNETESWRCVNSKCKGRLQVNGDDVREVTEHSHTPNPAECRAKNILSSLRSRASTSNDAARRIIQETQTQTPAESVALLPKYRSLQSTVQRKRRRNREPIAAPRNVAEIDIPEHLRLSLRGENFLLKLLKINI